VLEGVPEALPALAYATKLQKRAAKFGFDWDDAKRPADKVREELADVENATAEELEEELGDLVFASVALARTLGVDPETALRRTAKKFRDRLARMESSAGERGVTLKDLGPGELDTMWNETK